jgi:NitT/TauT family transport system ATP-binding protein
MGLVVENLSKTFETKKGPIKALDNINLEAKEGEFICIIGPSGCGKTTLLNVVAGLEKPDRDSTVSIDGTPVNGPGSDRIVIFQQDALFPWLNVTDNVEFGLKMKDFPKEKMRPLTEEFLQLVHMSKFRKSYIHELSGGMKQRVALARALVVNPKMLLMDEPLCALDAQSREILQDLIQKIWVIINKMVIFITHNIQEAVFLADRVLVFTARPGRIKKEFKVDLPRPRRPGSLQLLTISNLIRQELKDEIERAINEEVGDE